MTSDRSQIDRLKNTIITEQEVYTYIGMLTSLRVAHDSSDKRLSSKIDTYPLNQGQISVFTEEALKLLEDNKTPTAWDLYNIANRLYKPEKAEIPTLISQNVAFVDTLIDFCSERFVRN